MNDTLRGATTRSVALVLAVRPIQSPGQRIEQARRDHTLVQRRFHLAQLGECGVGSCPVDGALEDQREPGLPGVGNSRSRTR